MTSKKCFGVKLVFGVKKGNVRVSTTSQKAKDCIFYAGKKSKQRSGRENAKSQKRIKNIANLHQIPSKMYQISSKCINFHQKCIKVHRKCIKVYQKCTIFLLKRMKFMSANFPCCFLVNLWTSAGGYLALVNQ